MQYLDGSMQLEDQSDRPATEQHAEADSLLFAARMRAARAVLGWSQTELAQRANVTQRAIYRLEKAAVRARHGTEVRINKAFTDAGVEFWNCRTGASK